MAAPETMTRKMIATALGALLLGAMAIPGKAQAPAVANRSELHAPTTPEEIEAAKPNPQAPGFRIPLPSLEQMTPGKREHFVQEATGLHTPIGPRQVMFDWPNIEDASANFLHEVSKSGLPDTLFQLTILVTARQWDSQFEWWVHAPRAVEAGVAPEIVEAIRVGRMPTFKKPEEEAVYRYFMELYRDHEISDATYERLRALIGARQLVAFTELAGYYNTVAIDITAHKIPLREGVKPQLPKLVHAFPR